MAPEEFAPAKVNLFLHVGPRAADGYHPIRSLLTFADIGDTLSLAPSDQFELVIEGEFAGGLSAGADNLIVRAREAMLSAAARPCEAFRLTLTKSLPLASGLAGGTSDAAATMRLMNAASDLKLDEAVLGAIAAALGADGPACLRPRTLVAEGRGEVLREAPPMPILEAVLVNPKIASPTAQVYAAFDRQKGVDPFEGPALPERFRTTVEVADFLKGCRNDLEAPAAAREPLIEEVLGLLRSQAETLICRLSGSGATGFSLCADAGAANRLSERLQRLRPHWWVRPCRLGAASA